MKPFCTSPQIANTNWKTIFDVLMLKQIENKNKNDWNTKYFAKYEIVPISRHQPCLLFNEGEDTGSSSEQQQVTFVWKNKLYFVKTSKYILSKLTIIFCKKSYYFVQIACLQPTIIQFCSNQHLCSGKNTYMCIYILIFQNR